MESRAIRALVTQWRHKRTPFGGAYDWTGHALIFFEGARAGAIAAKDDKPSGTIDELIAEIDMVLSLIDTQGINPLLAMAPI